jgi:hypothetical protein
MDHSSALDQYLTKTGMQFQFKQYPSLVRNTNMEAENFSKNITGTYH